MKKILLVIVITILANAGYSQTPTEVPDGYKKGNILFFDSTSVSGLIKTNSLKSGKIIFPTVEKRKKTYETSLIKEFAIESDKYIIYKNDIFMELVRNMKLSLYQKQSSSDGKIEYNGTQPIIIAGSDGSIGDYFLSTDTGASMELLNKRNLADDIQKYCSNCPSLVAEIRAGKLSVADSRQIIQTCNNCN
jgi:hypothetical protein